MDTMLYETESDLFFWSFAHFHLLTYSWLVTTSGERQAVPCNDSPALSITSENWAENYYLAESD